MDRKQAAHMRNIKELLKDFNEGVLAEVKSLYKSGLIDPEKYTPADYCMAKILLTAALHRRKDAFAPMTTEYKKEVQNLIKA